jgi:hypothetical protein
MCAGKTVKIEAAGPKRCKTVKMEAADPSETLINIYHITLRCIPEDSTLDSRHLKSHKWTQ